MFAASLTVYANTQPGDTYTNSVQIHLCIVGFVCYGSSLGQVGG